MVDTFARRDSASGHTFFHGLLRDRVLVSAFVVCGLLIAYQLVVTLLQPPWIKPVTDWLRTALAWPQFLVMAWVAVCLLSARRPAGAVCWGLLGMLSYAVARTLWTIADTVEYPHGVPFPSLPDLFFILQYPLFFFGCTLLPRRDGWLPGARTVLDGLLWICTVTALSLHFMLMPIVRRTGEPPVSKDISLFYQIGDLVLLYAVVMNLARPHRTSRERLQMSLLSLAVVTLFVGDTWAALQMFQPPHTYRAGSWPDLFRFTCYLLFPLAALIQLRFVPAELPSRARNSAGRFRRNDLLAGVRIGFPSLAVVAASALIIVHATLAERSRADLLLAEAVSIALLLLATLRPAVMFLEQEQLRRERDAARTEERALRLANERMENFLSMVAHELRTPLTSLIGNVQLIARRLDILVRLVRNHEDYTNAANVLHDVIDWCDQSLERMRRLVEDVLDETRVRQGRLALRLVPRNLAGVVSEAVTEQAALNPERSIRLVAEASHLTVVADACRIEQVITNYVSNALKFSGEDQTVEVRVRMEDGVARVSVHDDGAGIPPADQPHIWDRFYQAAGVDVKSGSQVGFGIGLYISKAIIEGHHGQVGLESTPGQGTTFWFTLPLASPAAAPLGSQPPGAGAGDAECPLWPDEHEHQYKQPSE